MERDMVDAALKRVGQTVVDQFKTEVEAATRSHKLLCSREISNLVDHANLHFQKLVGSDRAEQPDVKGFWQALRSFLYSIAFNEVLRVVDDELITPCVTRDNLGRKRIPGRVEIHGLAQQLKKNVDENVVVCRAIDRYVQLLGDAHHFAEMKAYFKHLNNFHEGMSSCRRLFYSGKSTSDIFKQKFELLSTAFSRALMAELPLESEFKHLGRNLVENQRKEMLELISFRDRSSGDSQRLSKKILIPVQGPDNQNLDVKTNHIPPNQGKKRKAEALNHGVVKQEFDIPENKKTKHRLSLSDAKAKAKQEVEEQTQKRLNSLKKGKRKSN